MRRTTLRKRAALAAVTPLLLVGLTACGGDNSDNASDNSNSSQTSDESTSPDEGSSDGTESPDSAESSDSTDGSDTPAKGDEVDKNQFAQELQDAMSQAESAHMTMAMKGGPSAMTMEGDVDYTTDPPSMSAVMTAPGQGKIEFRLVDEFAYMNMGELTQNKFLKASINDKQSELGDLTGLRESMDPLSSFKSFSEGLEKVVYVGEEQVGGDNAEHYELTLDTAKITALDDLTGQQAAQSGLPEKLTYDVWLDSENRMRQVAMDMGKTLGSLQMSVSKWNEPVNIVAPKPNQITTLGG